MSSQGPLNWGTSANDPSDGGTVAWGGVGSPGTPSYGSVSGQTNYLKLTNFGFSVPGAATIFGIQVSLTTTKTGTGASDNSVKLIKGGVLTGSDKSAGASWGATNNYGSTGDVWGATLAPADVNASTFGVALQGNVSPGTSGALTGATITVSYGLTDVNTYSVILSRAVKSSRRSIFESRRIVTKVIPVGKQVSVVPVPNFHDQYYRAPSPFRRRLPRWNANGELLASCRSRR